jgi:hypothetical protein
VLPRNQASPSKPFERLSYEVSLGGAGRATTVLAVRRPCDMRPDLPLPVRPGSVCRQAPPPVHEKHTPTLEPRAEKCRAQPVRATSGSAYSDVRPGSGELDVPGDPVGPPAATV